VAGITVRTSNEREADPAQARIGALWGRWFEGGCGAQVPGAIDPERVYGVYSGYDRAGPDGIGSYDLTIGVAVPADATPPAPLVVRTIPPGRFARFEARGPMPGAIVATWERIWQTDLPRAFTADYELYDEAGHGAWIHVALAD